jgi:hypothetical protein
LEDRPTVPANIVTYTADQNSNVVLSKNPSLKVSGGANTDFGQSVENFVVDNAALKEEIVNAVIAAVEARESDMQRAVMRAALPIGTIVMWNGETTSIPCGWQIVSNLVGRFPVGAGDGGETSYSVGATGGEAKHVLTVKEMPEHKHGSGTDVYYGNRAEDHGGGMQSYWTGSGDDRKIEKSNWTEVVGEGIAHENRPPYYAVYFIKKTSNCKNSYED